jgi:hypothetical protein
MDFAQTFIFDMGWVFFAAWGMVLTAVSVIAFRADILATQADNEQQRAAPADR